MTLAALFNRRLQNPPEIYGFSNPSENQPLSREPE
jgi:hypothetical protein